MAGTRDTRRAVRHACMAWGEEGRKACIHGLCGEGQAARQTGVVVRSLFGLAASSEGW